MSNVFECSLQLLYFLILIPFLLEKQQETCPQNMQVNNCTGIIFYNSNYAIFYHLS